MGMPMVDQLKLLLPTIVLLQFHIHVTEGGSPINGSNGYKNHSGKLKLFVFGDSYADSGNWNHEACSWKEPYGLTFPGKPTGRFSNGKVLTDYIASFFRVESPVPWAIRASANKSSIRHGMNFAFGGTGVFDTFVDAPNMTVQIDFLQQLIKEQKLYTKHDLRSAVALVSAAGNDYPAYVYRGGKLEDLPSFTKTLINQLSINLERIHHLGVGRIMVASLQPMGCLPKLTISSSYQNCTETWNAASEHHNHALQEAVSRLNNGSSSGGKQVFHVLDMYSAFSSVLEKAESSGGQWKEDALRPCCVGVTSKYSCGDEDGGTKKYVVCEKPESSIFWDMVHPSQNGWESAISVLKASLHQLITTL